MRLIRGIPIAFGSSGATAPELLVILIVQKNIGIIIIYHCIIYKDRHVMRKLSVLLLISCISAITQAGYMSKPYPLRKLCIDSEYIAIAEVEKVSKRHLLFKSDRYQAILKINKVIKGNMNSSIIKVHFRKSRNFPLPPIYPEGFDVIAFLNKNDKGNSYNTIGFGYGTRVVRGQSHKKYNELINMFLATNINNDSNYDTNITECLVQCVEFSATQWDGLYDLFKYDEGMIRVDSYDDPHFSELLNTDQKNRLMNVLFTDSTDWFTKEILSLNFSKIYEQELKDKLIISLERSFRMKSIDLANITFDLSEYYDVEELFQLSKGFRNYSKHYDTNDTEQKEEIRKLIKVFTSVRPLGTG